LRELAESAGHNLHVNAAGLQKRQQGRDLAMPHQRIAAHQREMQWTVLIHQGQYALDKIVAAFVLKLPQI
jgi:hypothetical protein